ncbi:MAG: hypothetical protein J0M11_18615 [Anaerolineae bacterium]|nr:hypothetical protein [Anaerolineae bacterium]
MEWLVSLAGCFTVPIITLLGLLLGGWILYSNTTGAKKYQQERLSKLKDLRNRGVTAPAVILSAKNGIVDTRRGDRLMHMTLEVEIQPEGGSTFKTTFKDWLPVGRPFVSWGDRPEEVGKKIWVTYNPNDVNEIMFEYHDKERKYMLGYPAFAKLEKRNAEIEKTGEEAIATILETEDLELVHSYEKEMKTVMRVKLAVTPKTGEPFDAETQASFVNSALHKYAVGKKVIVKFNPQDRTQVAIIRSMG